MANEQLELAAHPTLGWAITPSAPSMSKKNPLVGLVIGLVLGVPGLSAGQPPA